MILSLTLMLSLGLIANAASSWRTVLKINNNVLFTEGHASDWYRTGPATFSTLAEETAYLSGLETAGTAYSLEATNFKSLLIDQWDTLEVEEVRISICDDDAVQKQVTFDGTNSDSENWLSADKIISSDWDDLDANTNVLYDAVESPTDGRDFTIIKNYGGCSNDAAWFVVSTRSGGCIEWAENDDTVFYSASTTAVTLSTDRTIGDALIVEIKYAGVCDEADMTNVNWHDMLNENVPSPSLLHREAITFNASTLSLTFSASLEYVGKSADGNFDDEFNLGTTYWIDFESFSSVDGDVNAVGTCTNRRSADYDGLSFANWWSYPVNPADLATESASNRMAYPPSNWTVDAVNCSVIRYERTMSWADLTSCRDADGNELITVENAETTLTLSGQLFVELLSPYSTAAAGYYRTFPLVQQRFEIVLNKGVDFLASTDVQLFIPSVMAYGRDDEGNYEVTVLIQSADFVKMNLNDVAAVTGPLSISGIETVAGDCLSASSFTCGQIFTAKIDAECSGDGNVDLSGSYNFALSPECRDSDGDGEAEPECQVFMDTLDPSTGNKVALTVDADFVDLCDVDLFTVDFTGSLTFYEDDQFTEAVDADSDPFVIGQDTIYGEVAVQIDVPSFPDLQFEDVAIQTVYVCTADPGKALSMESPVGSDGVGGCLSTDVDADALYTVIGDGAIPEYEGATIDETASNSARFSFLTFATGRETIYVHVQALLTVNIDGRRRRMRVLLQDDGNANQFRSYVGTASVVEGEDSVHEPSVVDGSARSAVNLVVVIMVFAAVMAG